MQPVEEVFDYDNFGGYGTSDYYYLDYDGSEWEFLDDEEEEEICEEEEEEEERKAKEDEIDIFADLLASFRASLAEKRVAKSEAGKEMLREMIGIKKKTGSEETLITSEEESVPSVESSAESSIHPCLKDVDISDSQLKLQNLYTMCPAPDDPGLIPAFWTIQDHRTTYADEDGVEMFFDLVHMSHIRPIQALGDMLLTEKINLQYYGLNSRVIRPLCEALTKNIFVNTVNLTGNWLSEDACYHLNDLLLRNNVVHTLLLSGCKIGPGGAAKFYDGIAETATLKILDLSDCNIRSEGFDPIARAMCKNESIETLLLNDNNLDETCADALQQMIASSTTLRRLGLSWNSLYSADLWKKLLKGFEENEALIDLDLSWNALGKECVPYLRRLLLRSSPLKKLHLNGNRFYDEDAAILARGLSKNERLEELYMGNNPMKGEGTLALVKSLTPNKAPNSPLRLLDLTNIWATKKIIPELENIRNNKPWLDIRLGGILSNYKLQGPDVQAILLKRANYEAMKPKKKRRRKNFGHFILSLSDEPITKGRFVELIRKFRLKLSQTLVDALAGAFAGLRHTVDQGLLKSVYLKHYPNTRLPPEKPPKKKKAKDKKEKKKKRKKQQ